MPPRTRKWISARGAMARSRTGQVGLALPLVLFLGVVLFLVIVAVSVRGLVGTNQADNQRKLNEALHTADGGTDRVLFELVENKNFATASPSGGGSQYDNPPAFSSEAEEKQWALGRGAIKAASGSVTNDPNLTALVKSQGGEWAVMKPQGAAARVLYAVGYTPSRANPEKTRVLRLEYDFPPFNAVNAILTGGNIQMGGNASISGSAGSIHTNGNFSWTGSSWDVDGAVAASGTFPSGSIPSQIGNPGASGGGKPVQSIPETNGLEHYPKSHYDLCPDGSVRAGKALPVDAVAGVSANPGNTPCTGTVIAASGGAKGWSRTGGAWTYQTSACNNGVFYVHLGNVSIKGNPGKDALTCKGEPWKATIIATATHPSTGHCPVTTGDIDIQGTPKMQPWGDTKILFVADRDFQMQGNAAGGGALVSGSILVHEQFKVTGSMTLTGNIIANDACDTSGSPVGQNIVNLHGSSSIAFNEPAELPLGNLIRITRWSEL